MSSKFDGRCYSCFAVLYSFDHNNECCIKCASMDSCDAQEVDARLDRVTSNLKEILG